MVSERWSMHRELEGGREGACGSLASAGGLGSREFARFCLAYASAASTSARVTRVIFASSHLYHCSDA